MTAFRADAVNAWAVGDSVVIAARRLDGYWTQITITSSDAVQMADQLYQLTKTEP